MDLLCIDSSHFIGSKCPDFVFLLGEDGGRVDFNNAAVTVQFQADTDNDLMPISVEFIDDLINEAQEGYIAMLEVVSISAADEARLDVSNRNITLIRINNDDGMLFFLFRYLSMSQPTLVACILFYCYCL